MPQEYIEKLHARIKKTKSCWIWTGANSGSGYGRFNILDRTYQAHRVAYEYFTQKKIPEGLVIDHLCRNPICVNPEHLEPVTPKENTLRGIAPSAKASRRSTCKYGHPLMGTNLKVGVKKGKPWRKCRTCENKHQQNHMLRKYGRPIGEIKVTHF